MTYTRVLPAVTTPQKPPSELTAGLTPLALNSLRNQLQISTWLCLGALAQTLLFLLPIKTYLACLPAACVLVFRILDNAAMVFGLRRNVYMDGVIGGKTSALYPSADENPEGPPASEEVCVQLLGAKTHHPLGMFAPGMKKMSDYFEVMLDDLEKNAAAHGWLGSNSYIKSTDRTSNSEVLMVHYFKTMDALHAFAHGKTHRDAWDWWNREAHDLKHIGIMHEAYSVPKGRWETIYGNYRPEGFGATRHAVVGKDGATRWEGALVEANRGKLRSSAGRVGLERTGGGNEKYGPSVWDV